MGSQKFLYACVESAEVDISATDTTGEIEEMTRVIWRVGGETWLSKDAQLNTSHKDVRKQKFTNFLF